MKWNNKNNTELILNGNMIKAIFALAIPIVINSFLQTMYNLTDTYWMGRLGTAELSAINLVTPVQNIVLQFGTGVTVAGAVLISQYIGAKDIKNARSMANQICACAVGLGAVCGALLCVLSPAIVGWLGAEGVEYIYGKTYLRLVVIDMPFLYIINIYTAVNQAQGNTVKPMLLNIVGVVLNLILDPLFMVVFGWGVAGAAGATVLSKVFPAMIAFGLLLNKKKDVYLNLRELKFEKEKLKKVVMIGFPTAVGGSSLQFGMLLMSRSAYQYGSQAMAAYGIGNKINGLITLPAVGIGSAVATIVGQNMGAGQVERAERGYRLSRNICVIFLLAGGIILSREPISTAIVRIFAKEEAVITLASEFLSILALYCFTNGVHNTTMGLFQGTGHTEVTMALDIIRLWIFRFVTLYVCRELLHMGVQSIWYSVVVSNALSALALYFIYKTKLWEKNRVGIKKKV